MKNYYVYILTNARNTVLYVGVTNDLSRRLMEHKEGINSESFTQRYNLRKLVYFEESTSATDAIAREKQIKGWVRAKKIELINSVNSEWKDLINCHPEAL